ncbi:uncharacterized protein with gpF-like domain [Moryella indoligenes]|uniref:Uncharacterized protein with gpF-like domain n=1 Tax=Moryella indoligenes TaxID=371674 RepID=A0AAE3VBN3_9FIRM|nr:hypothetical protein [Moryella indoligenes]MDQ0153157.1 uncharacterized protein with gpF-like domain [Moryella indoligenes]
MNEVYVHLLDFKTTQQAEAITKNEDSSYSIFLNSRLSSLMLKDAYEHALKHIQSGDFEKDDVQEIELEAHIDG